MTGDEFALYRLAWYSANDGNVGVDVVREGVMTGVDGAERVGVERVGGVVTVGVGREVVGKVVPPRVLPLLEKLPEEVPREVDKPPPRVLPKDRACKAC